MMQKVYGILSGVRVAHGLLLRHAANIDDHFFEFFRVFTGLEIKHKEILKPDAPIDVKRRYRAI